MASLNKQGLLPELVAYKCLLNWVFLTGKRCSLLPFLGIIAMVMGEWGCRNSKGDNRLGRYWDLVVS